MVGYNTLRRQFPALTVVHSQLVGYNAEYLLVFYLRNTQLIHGLIKCFLLSFHSDLILPWVKLMFSKTAYANEKSFCFAYGSVIKKKFWNLGWPFWRISHILASKVNCKHFCLSFSFLLSHFKHKVSFI